MHPTILLVTAIVLPLVWGWLIHWLWRRRLAEGQSQQSAQSPAAGHHPPTIDYQI
jgi:hypothetical protein